MQKPNSSIYCALLVTLLVAVFHWNRTHDKLKDAMSGHIAYMDHYGSVASTTPGLYTETHSNQFHQRHEDINNSVRIKTQYRSSDIPNEVEVREQEILLSKEFQETIRPESLNVTMNQLRDTQRREVCSSYKTYAESRARYQDKLSLDWIHKVNDTPKTILLWNAFFNQEDYGIGLGAHVFDKCSCPVLCELTRDKAQLETADAILVHTFFLRTEHTLFPTRTRKDQVFVFFLLESPLVAQPGMMDYDYNGVFNLTMTYLDDPVTDIYAPVGDFIEMPSPDVTIPNLQTVKMKQRPVAWLVSNCNPLSARNEYISELSKYIPIDRFGKCGNLSCPEKDDWGNECMRNISDLYLFYLSFENSYCDGYITEKVYRTLQFDIVPIVYGGGSYSLKLPPKSYIDVSDYQSPKHLAEYLYHLSDNPEEYLDYFKWKRTWAVRGDYHHRARGFCKLCKILHSGSYPYKSNFDLLNYWSPTRLCSNRTEELKRVHLE